MIDVFALLSQLQPAELDEVWVYLSRSPLLHLTATLAAYQLAYRIYRATNNNPLANPVAIAIVVLIAFLKLTGTPYETYFEGAKFVHFLLGPATVALAIPLYHQLPKLRSQWLPTLVAIVVGVMTAGGSAMVLAQFLGASPETVLSLAPKSTTAPVAMAISESIGGLASLTAVLVILTGILGAVFGTRLLDCLGIEDETVRGVAMGVTSHGIGTARAFQISGEMGAFSGLAMALSAGAASVLVPWLVQLS